MTFAQFTDMALYHPSHGYYTSSASRIGPEGDFYTSTDVSPLFGATVGRQLYQMWQLLERPRPFTVVEYGAGKGLLAADVLGWMGAAHNECFQALEYVILEISPALRARQSEQLRLLPVRWLQPRAIPPDSLVGCVISNEVADALPFHRVQQQGSQLEELWVIEGTEGLVEDPQDPSTSALEDYLTRDKVRLPDTHKAEIRLAAQEWAREQAEMLHAGFILTIDYGDTAESLYGGRYPEGTLACYHRHSKNQEPFCRIGEQDITAHVDFSALARAYRDAGASVTGLTTQAFFLASLGLGDALIIGSPPGAGAAELRRNRNAVEELIRPDGLGSFKVLVAHKGLEEPDLTGLSLGSRRI